MDQRLYDAVTASPIIAAVKDMDGLEHCLTSENIQMVFLLFGDIVTIPDLVARVKDAGKLAMVHTDLITGLAPSKEVVVDYLKNATRADGILSTRPNFIRRARELNLFTILRIFVIDSMALTGIEKLGQNHPDFIEIMPGVMPKTIRRICQITDIPLLAGGLITDKEDVFAALNAGAMAISTTRQDVWDM